MSAPSRALNCIDVSARLGKNQFLLAAGDDAREALKPLIASGEWDNLHGVDSIKETVGSLGGEVAFALVVEPLRIVASRAGKPGLRSRRRWCWRGARRKNQRSRSGSSASFFDSLRSW